MHLTQRKVPERKADAVSAGTEQFPHVRLGRTAERTLVVPVFDEGHRSRRGPEYVVTFVHGRHEPGSIQVSDHAGTRSYRVESGQDPVHSGIHLDRGEVAPADLPFAVDDEQGPLGHPEAILVGPVALGHLALRLEVGKQGEVEVPGRRVGRVTPRAVDRDPDERGAEPLELGQCLVVEGQLVAAHRAPIGRIERHHQVAAPEVGQLRLRIRRHGKFEGRGARSRPRISAGYRCG